MSTTPGSSSGRNNPADFLKTILGRPVVVKLNSGVDYRGALLLLRGFCGARVDHHRARTHTQRHVCYARAQAFSRAWTAT